MERKTVDELLDLMDAAEDRIGESCIEYVGYGYAKNFANFLYKEKHLLEKKELDITIIWAYLDVLFELEEDLFDEEGDDDYYGAGLKLVAEFLVSDYCKDECYDKFIEAMNAYINGVPHI